MLLQSTLALAAVLSAVVTAAPAASGVLHIPVAHPVHDRRSSDDPVDVSTIFANLKRLTAKYDIAKPDKVAKRIVATEKLSDYLIGSDGVDYSYYGVGAVGSNPRQYFNFSFDTGSADNWVYGPNCNGCPTGSTRYSEHGTYEGNSSTISYGGGTVSGRNFYDQFCVSSICAGRTNIVSLTSYSMGGGGATQGLIGMAFSSIAVTKQPTFVEKLIASRFLTNNQFSFYLGRVRSGTSGNSQITIGGNDTSKYTGSFTTFPVAAKTYWSLNVASTSVNGAALSGSSGFALVDSGTTFAVAPNATATAVFQRIPGSQIVPNTAILFGVQLWTYPCNTPQQYMPVFSIGSQKYDINTLDFNGGVVPSSAAKRMPAAGFDGSHIEEIAERGDDLNARATQMCYSNFVGADVKSPYIPSGTKVYILGDTFMKNWYTVFNYNNGGTISFAKSV